MRSAGAKSLRGWGRFTARFLRGYGLALLLAALLLLAADLAWPAADLFGALARLLSPDS